MLYEERPLEQLGVCEKYAEQGLRLTFLPGRLKKLDLMECPICRKVSKREEGQLCDCPLQQWQIDNL